MTVIAPPARTEVKLVTEQSAVLSGLLDGARRRVPVQTLGGYAGTGKTTLLGAIVRELPDWAVVAFTGKAVNVLNRKGVEASTIHGLIYEIDKARSTPRKPVFVRRSHLACSGIIIDEASMVSEEIFKDLLSYGVPIIAVGDHGQLEPIGSAFNLMSDPDYRLEKIHRNAGEISRFAEWIRRGKAARTFPREATGQVEFPSLGEIDERGTFADVDQVICGLNKSRVVANTIVRDLIWPDDPGRMLFVGERVMCLQNDRKRLVFNGMQGTVVGFSGPDPRCGPPTLDLDSYGELRAEIPFDPDQFHRVDRPEIYSQHRIPFDYAYCITCHKSQGDEFDTTLVFEQKARLWDPIRWAYTAASRAKVKVYWARR